MLVIIPTNDRYLWCLRPFAYLFNVYWSENQPVLVAGNEEPELPDNFEFLHVSDYPADRWSDQMIKTLQSIDDYAFVLMLEDYWLCRTVPCGHVESLAEYMRINPDVLRIDLTNDRLHSGQATDVGYWGSVDLLETLPGVPYQLSLQASVFNRENFLRCLKPGMGPWDVELQGTELISDGLRILGTRNNLLRYVNAVGMGGENRYRTEHVRDGMGGRTIERIPQEHVEVMLAEGILPENESL